jgi:hypothetical protein
LIYDIVLGHSTWQYSVGRAFDIWRQLSRSPRIRLEVEIGARLVSDFPCDLPQRRKENYETKMGGRWAWLGRHRAGIKQKLSFGIAQISAKMDHK